MGFLCCNTRFPSLSPQIGERARERKERWLSPSQSYTSHDKWQRHRQTVHGESFVFLTVTLPHSLSHSAHTNLAHCSLSGMGADIKSRLCLSVIHSEDISLLSLGWCLNIELWPPVPAEVGVFDSKPTGTGQKNSLEAAASSAKVALVLLLSVSPLPPPPPFFLLSFSIISNNVAISTAHHSRWQCPWHNWASAKWNRWHHPLCLCTSPVRLWGTSMKLWTWLALRPWHHPSVSFPMEALTSSIWVNYYDRRCLIICLEPH